MKIQPEFKELFELFNSHEVEYLIIGAYALAFHGVPRATGDIDLYVRPTRENAEKVLRALDDFGFGGLDLEVGDFTTTGQVIQLGYPPRRIDLLTSIAGLGWQEAHNGRVEGAFDDVAVNFLGRADLIRNKQATGRLQDRADIESLGDDDAG